MDTLFFICSKLLWAFARPDHLLLLLLTLAVVRSRWRRAGLGHDRRQGYKVLWFTLVLLWLIALYPAGNLLLYPLESRYRQQPIEPDQLAGIVVLGGGESLRRSRYWQQLQLDEGGDRVLEMLELARRYPQLPVLFTGGSGSVIEQGFGSADALALLLDQHGLSQRITLERRARNTYENGLLSVAAAARLAPTAGDKPWLLVTSAFHMPRSVGVFETLGWRVVPHPVDYRALPPPQQRWSFSLAENLQQLNLGMREWIGLIAYRLSGKTQQLLPPMPCELQETSGCEN